MYQVFMVCILALQAVLVLAMTPRPLIARKMDSMKDRITLDYLKNHTEHVITCAKWSYNQWGHHTPERMLQDFIESRKDFLNDTSMPLTLLAFDGQVPIGMVSLTKSKHICPDLSPWLSTIYVTTEYRGRGVGSMLEAKICDRALEMGYKKIYLYTSEIAVISWYEKLGWRKKCIEWLHNHYVNVMEKDLE